MPEKYYRCITCYGLCVTSLMFFTYKSVRTAQALVVLPLVFYFLKYSLCLVCLLVEPVTIGQAPHSCYLIPDHALFR